MNDTKNKAQSLAAALVAAGFDITVEGCDIVVDIADDFRVDVQVQNHDIIVETLAVFLDREIGWDSATISVDSYATEDAAVEAILKRRKDYQDDVARTVAEERAYDEAMAATAE